MRLVDDEAIRHYAATRFRSEYDYALFEYWRSAKLLRWLERAGLERLGRVLDDGCGGGGMCVSIAEETELVIGIDLDERFAEAGTRLARERGVANLAFAQSDGCRLPFPDGTFDTVLSHAVIEHVADYRTYLRDAYRVLRPGGRVFLQTAPVLSPSGSHLPRLKVRVPLYLLVGRRAAYAAYRWIAANRPHWIDTPPEASSFLTAARNGRLKVDDVTYRVTVRSLRRAIRGAGFRIVREDLQVSGLARRCLPERVAALLPAVPFARDVLITNMEYLLAR
ncbi:MAG: class I SAM-dependent methyltransferase [Acidobacteria bacterium]|nr:class I SAM-dependent methyltransferase [Acidobacteriota bacterium]